MAASPDRSRFLKLYLAAQPPLRSFLLGILRNAQDADDVFQEVSLVLWERFGDYDDRFPFLSWAFGIARNHAARWRRARPRARLWLPPEVEEKLAVTQLELEEELSVRRQALRHCVQKLGARARELVSLRYEARKSLQEIAETQRTTLNAVNKALGKIRKFLADCTGGARLEGVEGT
jgi:RNA polymerase sigma-70 factor (ECF subfamily)